MRVRPLCEQKKSTRTLNEMVVASQGQQGHSGEEKTLLLCREVNLSSPTSVTYLLAPWGRVLLQKLTGLQLVKKFTAFHETRRFITALTSARHLSLS